MGCNKDVQNPGKNMGLPMFPEQHKETTANGGRQKRKNPVPASSMELEVARNSGGVGFRPL